MTAPTSSTTTTALLTAARVQAKGGTTAEVIRAYLDALDPAEVAQLASGDLVDWTAAVLKAVRP